MKFPRSLKKLELLRPRSSCGVEMLMLASSSLARPIVSHATRKGTAWFWSSGHERRGRLDLRTISKTRPMGFWWVHLSVMRPILVLGGMLNSFKCFVLCTQNGKNDTLPREFAAKKLRVSIPDRAKICVCTRSCHWLGARQTICRDLGARHGSWHLAFAEKLCGKGVIFVIWFAHTGRVILLSRFKNVSF